MMTAPLPSPRCGGRTLTAVSAAHGAPRGNETFRDLKSDCETPFRLRNRLSQRVQKIKALKKKKFARGCEKRSLLLIADDDASFRATVGCVSECLA